jgi:hypothetical protein
MGLIEYNGIYGIEILLTFFTFILRNVRGKQELSSTRQGPIQSMRFLFFNKIMGLNVVSSGA